MGVDSDLWLRGHLGTRNGRKGNGFLAREFVLVNWELNRRLFRRSFVSVSAGPFLDCGRVHEPLKRSAARLWQFDAGAQARVNFMGLAQVVFSYGRGLRSGRGIFDVNDGLPFDFFASP